MSHFSDAVNAQSIVLSKDTPTLYQRPLDTPPLPTCHKQAHILAFRHTIPRNPYYPTCQRQYTQVT